MSNVVSVIIPYCEEFTPRLMLEDAIESVEKQSVPTEIHVIEDPEKRGPSWARNKGMQQANTRYIAFLDADDLWQPNKLEEQLTAMENTGAGLSVEGNPEDSNTFITNRINESISCPTSSVTIDTNKVDVQFRTELERFEDHLFMIEAALQSDVCLCPDIVTVRKHDESLSNDGDHKLWYQERLKLAKIIETEYPNISGLSDSIYSRAYYSKSRHHQIREEFPEALEYARKSIKHQIWWKPVAVIGLSKLGKYKQSISNIVNS
ncbi:glycosyl transferase [Halobiforma nitratireducens JCM 10879]|uniref:Glycosyl transferase n=2 Tax=Halobiforma nitratireducens TaxID=130048 RepID=M0MRN6_9EURY|nr:glycosyl transferase [Halobiforma nitratireducens JCM 10879]